MNSQFLTLSFDSAGGKQPPMVVNLILDHKEGLKHSLSAELYRTMYLFRCNKVVVKKLIVIILSGYK